MQRFPGWSRALFWLLAALNVVIVCFTFVGIPRAVTDVALLLTIVWFVITAWRVKP